MKAGNLKRKLNPMPAYVRKLLNEKGLMNAYKASHTSKTITLGGSCGQSRRLLAKGGWIR